MYSDSECSGSEGEEEDEDEQQSRVVTVAAREPKVRGVIKKVERSGKRPTSPTFLRPNTVE